MAQTEKTRTRVVPREPAPRPVDPGVDIGHVHLKTADIERVKRFYVDILGFDVIARIPGLRVVDCGRLESARFIEGLTPLLISVNARHKTHAGVKLTGLPEALW